METSSMKKYVAELIGTAVLVLMGTGSVIIGGSDIGLLGYAIAFGLAMLVMVYAIGGISGSHINPAVTIAMLAAGKIKTRDAVAYIIAQCIGAVIASGILLVIALGLPRYSLALNGLGQNGYGNESPSGYSLLSGLIAEITFTALFVFVIFGATSKNAPKGFAGIAIGLTLTLIHLVSLPITGTSVNPARSLGPAVYVQGVALQQLWLFWVAPIMGGLIAALVWIYLFEPRQAESSEST